MAEEELRKGVHFIWYGRTPVSFEDAFQGRRDRGFQDRLDFASDPAQLEACLASGSNPTCVLLNMPADRFEEFFALKALREASERLVVAVPFVSLIAVPRSARENFLVEPFIYFFPDDAIRSLPEFVENAVAKLQPDGKPAR